MYNLIKKLGNLLRINESNYNYQCTYAWAVIGSILVAGLLTYGQVDALVVLTTQGMGAIKDTHHGIFILTDMVILSAFGLFALAKLGSKFPVFSFYLVVAFFTLIFLIAHYAAFTTDPELKALIFMLDGLLLLLGFLYLNQQFNLKDKVLNKFCKRI